MKTFEIPKMTVIRLTREDIIRTSTCYGFDCPDCPTQCTGTYHCDIFDCHSVYTGNLY